MTCSFFRFIIIIKKKMILVIDFEINSTYTRIINVSKFNPQYILAHPCLFLGINVVV